MFPDLGLEKTPHEYVERIVAIMAEIYRVLRDDGVVWLNMGDCYAGSGGENLNTGLNRAGTGKDRSHLYRNNPRESSIRQGNLMLMPHRIAIALQDWGWIVRNDCVWRKANPMPESVNGWRFEGKRCECAKLNKTNWSDTGDSSRNNSPFGLSVTQVQKLLEPDSNCPDCRGSGKIGDPELRKGSWRHTRAHEYIFMLTKKMQYWSNQEAVREGHQSTRWGGEIITQPPDTKYAEATAKGFAGAAESLSRPGREWNAYPSGGRNPRSVLDVPTAPYKGSHYACYPPNLIAPLIRATCPRWACPVCGQGWSPVVEKSSNEKHEIETYDMETWGDGAHRTKHAEPRISNVKGSRPTCEHYDNAPLVDGLIPNGWFIHHEDRVPVPGIIFDPFVGSGTTVMVAKQLLRRGIGIDISMEYLDKQAKVRAKLGSPSNVLDDLPLFNFQKENNETGFFCPKCGTVYTEIDNVLRCLTCNPVKTPSRR